jgi:glycosyltransferase involved in cell wall biosynthesis
MKISVAIPVLNEEGTLVGLLDSLLAQTVAPDEIVIADGGSTDGTVALARAYEDRGVLLLEIGPAYPGRGRNAAIRAARHEWLALIDGGCVADRTWLERLLAARDTLGSREGVVFGDCKPCLGDEWDVAQALAFVGPPDQQTGLLPPFIASSLLHRRVWETTGGFPEHLRAAEDLVFLKRLDELRVRVVRSPDAVVRWRLALGPRGVWRRLRLYSAHHLAAGLFRTWHLRVMAMDLVAAGLLGAAILWPASIFVVCLGAAARLLRTVARRRHNVPGRWAFRPDRLCRVALLLMLADTATWAGALDYALGREPPR